MRRAGGRNRGIRLLIDVPADAEVIIRPAGERGGQQGHERRGSDTSSGETTRDRLLEEIATGVAEYNYGSVDNTKFVAILTSVAIALSFAAISLVVFPPHVYIGSQRARVVALFVLIAVLLPASGSWLVIQRSRIARRKAQEHISRTVAAGSRDETRDNEGRRRAGDRV